MANKDKKLALWNQVRSDSNKITYDYVMLGVAQYFGDISDKVLIRLTKRTIEFYDSHEVNYDDLFYAVYTAYSEHCRLTDNNILAYLPL